LHTVEIKTLKL